MSQETFAILFGLIVGPIAAIPTIVLIFAIAMRRDQRRYYRQSRIVTVYRPVVDALGASEVRLLDVRSW